MFPAWPIFTPFRKVEPIPKRLLCSVRRTKDQREYIHQNLPKTKGSLCLKSLKLLRGKVSLEVKRALGIKPLAQHNHCKHAHHFPVQLSFAVLF